MIRFTFHSDPGHAWLEVPLVMLRDLNIHKRISTYSYKDASNAYLEEDCDAPVFLDAFALKHGRSPNLDPLYSEDTFIRNLPRFIS